MKPLILIVYVTTLVLTTPLFAQQATIAVASNFIHPMKALIRYFHRHHPHRIQASYGSSGKIYAQITNAAPFDLFFSADSDKPRRLVTAKYASERLIYCYAIGRLVLWSSQKNKTSPLLLLKSNQFKKLALANKKLAPYGQAAVEVLSKLKLMKTTESRWVLAENVAQSYQFVKSGNAQLGFIALSQIMRQHKINQGSVWLVPKELYNPVRQDVVLLKRAENNAAAHAFFQFIQSEPAKDIMAQYGYLF